MRSSGSSMAAASASIWMHMPITSTLSPALLNSSEIKFSFSGIDSISSSPTLTTTSTRRLVSRKYGARSSLTSSFNPARYSGRPSESWSQAICSASVSATIDLSSFAARWVCLSRFSTVSKSASANSISTMRRCSIGSDGPTTSSSSNARNTKTIASTSRMLARNLLPRPSPVLAPSTRPPMSTTST